MNLSKQFPDSRIVITVRSEEGGEKALKEAKRDNISYIILDISKPETVEAALEYIKKEGGVKVFVNNAAIVESTQLSPTPYNGEDVINVNYFATIDLAKKILPYVSEDGRILNVSSTLGLVDDTYSDEYKKVLLDDNATEEAIADLATKYIELEKKVKTEIFKRPYSFSKALLNAWNISYTKRNNIDKPLLIGLNPGWVRTELGGSAAPLSPDEGADRVIFLCVQPLDYFKGKQGKFFVEGVETPLQA